MRWFGLKTFWSNLIPFDVKDNIFGFIRSILDQHTFQALPRSSSVSNGTTQGNVISTTLFNNMVNDLVSVPIRSDLAQFVCDSSLWCCLNGILLENR